jgi:hypothetical protein
MLENSVLTSLSVDPRLPNSPEIISRAIKNLMLIDPVHAASIASSIVITPNITALSLL